MTLVSTTIADKVFSKSNFQPTKLWVGGSDGTTIDSVDLTITSLDACMKACNDNYQCVTFVY